jgi:hypothetical protein
VELRAPEIAIGEGLARQLHISGNFTFFKGAAVSASSKPGPFQEFYAALLAKGMRPEMARLTLARKIATIVLIVWKKGVCFDAQHLKPQTAFICRQ